MVQIAQGLGDRIAEEAQLLSEEKWIIDALTQVRTQRNCLQIERLQLESLEGKLKAILDGESPQNQQQVHNDAVAAEKLNSTLNNMELELAQTTQQSILNLDLDSCYDEELDLAVSQSIFSQEFRNNILDEDEEEDEEEEEDDDDDNMVIDMNMFMNAK